MKGDADVIQVLNDVLTAELTAINQYFIHAMMCRNWRYERLQKRSREESIGEMKHAEELIDRILYLDGVPNMQRYMKVNVGQDVPEQQRRHRLTGPDRAAEHQDPGTAVDGQLGPRPVALKQVGLARAMPAGNDGHPPGPDVATPGRWPGERPFDRGRRDPCRTGADHRDDRARQQRTGGLSRRPRRKAVGNHGCRRDGGRDFLSRGGSRGRHRDFASRGPSIRHGRRLTSLSARAGRSQPHLSPLHWRGGGGQTLARAGGLLGGGGVGGPARRRRRPA